MEKINDFFLSESRKDCYKLIDKYTMENIPLLFLIGESGVGKSRFLKHLPSVLLYLEVVILDQFYENSEQLFNDVLKKLNLPSASSKLEMTQIIAQHATDLLPSDKRLMLVIDDISGISQDIVADVTKLFDYEYNGKKVLSMLFVANTKDFQLIKEWQEQFFTYINSSVLYLNPFNRIETTHLFKLACEKNNLDVSGFNESDMLEIYKYTEGIPYRITKIPELLHSFDIGGKITIKDVHSIIKSTNIIKSHHTVKKSPFKNLLISKVAIFSFITIIGFLFIFIFYQNTTKKLPDVNENVVKDNSSHLTAAINKPDNIPDKPVETAAPKQAITKKEKSNKECIILKANLKIRNKPDLNASFKKVVPRGTKLEILEKQDDWSKITYKGITGWINSSPNLVKKVPCE
jgi:hypothetical protein